MKDTTFFTLLDLCSLKWFLKISGIATYQPYRRVDRVDPATSVGCLHDVDDVGFVFNGNVHCALRTHAAHPSNEAHRVL